MRHLLIALLIALLPLRAWVGDTMAVSMLGHSSAALVAETSTDVHPACPDHAAPLPTSLPNPPELEHATHAMGTHPSEAAHPGAGQVQDHHPHGACDVCNVPALVMESFDAVTAAQTHTQLVPPTERFASIALQQGIKPPIS